MIQLKKSNRARNTVLRRVSRPNLNNKKHAWKPVKLKKGEVAPPRKVSRQRAWQIKQRELGLCWKCGNPAVGALCLRHTKLERERQRNLRGWSKRNKDSLSYQI